MAASAGGMVVDADAVRRQWADRSGEFSPAYYAHYGPNRTSEVLLDVLDRFVGREAAILELGCSSGRHLSHLHRHGFDNLAGIEINEDAFDVMADAYPDLAARGTFYPGAIEEVVDRFEDGCFDAVYSVETLQHLHPETDWVFESLARITDDLLVTVENEGGDSTGEGDCEPGVNYVNGDVPLYYRNWNRIFTDLGFEQVAVKSGDRDTVRTFRTR